MHKIQKSTTLYAHPFSKAYWRDAAAEFKDVKMLVFAALMIAVRVAMKGLYIPLGPTLRINTAFVANALGAMVFGPVMAIPAAIISDFLGWVLFPTGPYFVPYIFVEIAGSVIFALFLYRTKVTPMRAMLSRFAIDLFVNIIMTAPINLWYYDVILGKSYMMFQIPHMLKELFMFPIESVVLTLFLSVMLPITNRMHLTYTGANNENVGKLRFSKKQWAFMAALFLVGCVCLVSFLGYYYDNNSISGSFSKSERYDYNCQMNDVVLDNTDDWDDEVTVTIIEGAYKKVFKGYTTYKVAVYVVNEEIMAQNAEEIKAEDPKAVYDLDTLRGYSKTPASKDTALTCMAYATIQVKDKTGEVLSFELVPADPQ